MALPKVIHVREGADNDGTKYLLAFKGGVMEAIEDDGPTTVGVYKLVGTRRARKTFVVEERPKKRRAAR